MEYVSSLAAVLARLRREGYTEIFDLRQQLLTGQRSALRLAPDEFVVDSQHRFGAAAGPATEAVVYAISCLRFNVKGTLVNGRGVSSPGLTAEFIRLLTAKIG
jgi:hypothetical protein